MASIKIVLRKEIKQDGTSPLAIRITKNRKTSYVYLEYSVKEKDWDKENQRVKKSHPNSARLNNFLLAKLASASDTSIELELSKGNVSSKAIRQKVVPQAGSTFLAQADLYLKKLRDDGKFNRHSADKPRVERFREFLEGSDIALTDVSVAVLNKFQTHLRSTRKISERTVINHLVVVRSVFSMAISEGVIDKKYYPFGKGQIIIKFPETTKVGRTKDDVEKLEAVELDNPAHHHARNIWLFSYYFAGMRASDVFRLRWSDFQDTRLHYVMGKNNKAGSVKAIDKAIAIMEQYKAEKRDHDDLIFPDLKKLPNLDDRFEVERRINAAVSRCDKMLKRVATIAEIQGKISLHISRHTFATLAGDKISPQMLQKLYRHSSITTTIGYQGNFIHKDADDALDAVIGKLRTDNL